jgi:hypothetical protein
MTPRARFAVLLLCSLSLACSNRSSERASSLFEPLGSADVLGFFWSSGMQGLTELLPSTGDGLDVSLVPLMPDATVLGMFGAKSVDASRPATIAFVDPQVYTVPLAYVLPITGDAEFLDDWRALKGMQEVAGEELHFFANRRTLKLTSANMLGLPQAEVQRHDYYLRFRDHDVFVLPSKDAESAVRHLLDRFNLRAPREDLNEFLSLDIDRLIATQSDAMQLLRELVARTEPDHEDGDPSPLVAYAALTKDVGQWALARVTDIDHFWLARTGTTFSSRVALKPGSPLREDLRLLGGAMEKPFARVPPSATLALDLALDPARLGSLVAWLVDRLPRDGERVPHPASHSPDVGRVKRIQTFGTGQATAILAECADEASAVALVHALVPETAAGALDRPVEAHVTLPALLGAGTGQKISVWCVARGPWCAFQIQGQGELLEPALAASGPGTLGAKVPSNLLAGAFALVYAVRHEAGGAALPYVARLGWSGDQLVIDGRDLEAQ